MEFTISNAWAGHTLVAFELLTRGGLEIAAHADIDDAAQTVTVGEVPLIGTTLVDDLDGDQYIAQAGSTVIDTVSYENLEPSTEYTVSGELIDQQTGTPTGIVGSTTFTSSATGTGTVEVAFTITADWAGHTLTAFEVVAQGDVEVAWHEDLDDAAQTVYVADLGTTLVDAADGDQNVAATGGTVIDTVAYTNLVPLTGYTVSGELIDRETGLATGIVGSATFVSSDTGSGTVEVEFVITAAFAGRTLVAFEVVTRGDLVVATHEDINDAAQTITVAAAPSSSSAEPSSSAVPSSSGSVPTATTTIPTRPLASTGVGASTVSMALGALLALALGAGLVWWSRQHRFARDH